MRVPPPDDALYELLEYKAELVAAHGIVDGFAAYRDAYPIPAVRRTTATLRSTRDFARQSAVTYREIWPAGEPFVAEPPIIIGPSDAVAYSCVSRTWFVAEFSDVLVTARSSILRVGDVALFDFQDAERERSDDREQLDPAIFALSGETLHVIEPEDGPVQTIAEAFVALLAPQSRAFGHWIWHQLPRFVAALELGDLPAMPVLVDAEMPATHFEALQLLIGERDMPQVRVQRGDCVRVERAWYASAPLFVPYVPVNDERWTWAYAAVPAERWKPILASFRRRASAIGGSGRGKRIYLARRPGQSRKLVNAEEIETIAASFGFEKLFLEEFAFADQVRIVRDATHIIGPEGSAMAACFFATPGLKVAILDHPFVAQLTNLNVILAAADAELTVLTGAVVNKNDSPGFPTFGYKHFADYRIDTETFSRFIGDWCPA